MYKFLPGIASSQVREYVEEKFISSLANANTVTVFVMKDLRR